MHTLPTERATGWLIIIGAAFTTAGILFSLHLYTWDAEWGYVTLGRLVVDNGISLFQDELIGERLPLPYYLIGLSQLAGPTLLGARLASLVCGVVTVVLTFAAARGLAGNAAGLLAALFLTTHGLVVGYYAIGSYFALCAALVAGGVAAHVAVPRPWGGFLCMACFTALAFSRANLAVMAPLVLVYLVVVARTRWERLALVAICALPPLIFFSWSADHLKILAYVPWLDRLVAPLGYRSGLSLGGSEVFVDRALVDNLIWFAKRHAPWLAATAVIAAGLGLRRLHGTGPSIPVVVFHVAVLALYTLAWQAVILRMYLKSVAAWAVAFAPLWAIVLGCGAAVLLSTGGRKYRLGVVKAVGCGVLLLVSAVMFTRHPAMPRPLPEISTIQALDEAASAIAGVVPEGEPVFVFGNPLPTYLAGARPYLRQSMHYTTLVPATDEFAIERSGMWGRRHLEYWLSTETRYAVVEPDVVARLRRLGSYVPLMDRMDELLSTHFSPVVEAGGRGGAPRQIVYARR